MFKLSNKGFFKVKDNRILLNRCGSANGQIQRHFYKACDINGNVYTDIEEIEQWKNSMRRPPLRKGIFTFPAPFNDAFYYHHFYEKHLPKEFTSKNPFISKWNPFSVYRNILEKQEYEKYISNKREILFQERSKALKKIYSIHRLKKIWYKGTIYSHICPKKMVDDGRNWWKYDSVADWIDSARKHIWNYYSYSAGEKNIFCGKINIDPGFFELFIPAK